MTSFKELQIEWDKKLKESGFEDIEIRGDIRRFRRGHIRHSEFKNVGGFATKFVEYELYYRVIGLYAHYCYNCDLVLDKYRDILKELAMVGSIEQAVRNCKRNVKAVTVRGYLHRAFPKMLEFVKNLDKEVGDE